jgi:hypothetical protein
MIRSGSKEVDSTKPRDLRKSRVCLSRVLPAEQRQREHSDARGSPAAVPGCAIVIWKSKGYATRLGMS